MPGSMDGLNMHVAEACAILQGLPQTRTPAEQVRSRLSKSKEASQILVCICLCSLIAHWSEVSPVHAGQETGQGSEMPDISDAPRLITVISFAAEQGRQIGIRTSPKQAGVAAGKCTLSHACVQGGLGVAGCSSFLHPGMQRAGAALT